jgi:hypothetical protein
VKEGKFRKSRTRQCSNLISAYCKLVLNLFVAWKQLVLRFTFVRVQCAESFLIAIESALEKQIRVIITAHGIASKFMIIKEYH